MTQPTYGFQFLRGNTQVLPAVTTDMSSVFLIGVSDDAVSGVVPLNQVVVFNSNDPSFLAGLGTGDLLTAVQLINAQLAPYQVAARLAVYRVAAGASDAETIANILGSQAAGTGIYAALNIGPMGFVPRLIYVAGGYTGKHITRSSVTPVVAEAAKFGGNTGNGLLTLASPAYGTGGSAPVNGIYRVRCATAAANGGVFSVVDPNGNVVGSATVGTPFAGPVKFTIADGATDFALGDGFDVTVTIGNGLMNANAIVASLPQIEGALLAHSIVDGPNTTPQDAIDFRATITSDHTVLVDFGVTPAAWTAGTFTAGGACVVGNAIATDFARGGIPSQSWANLPVQGITALQRYDSFSLNDGATIGQELLAQHIGICERGNAGDPGAASEAGFTQIVAFNCATLSEWQFLNVTRMRDYINLNIQRLWRARIGVNNITVQAVDDVLNDAIRFLGSLKADEHIIDFRVGVNAADNSPATIRAGGLRVYYKAEESSPLLLITADNYRYPDALNTLIGNIAGETNALITTAATVAAAG